MYTDDNGYAEYNRKIVEYLAKGRFYQILEKAEPYSGELNRRGTSIEEVMQISDRQKINRLRQKNGGLGMLQWLQWSDRRNQKISDQALEWLTRVIRPGNARWLFLRMSPEAAMNYIKRQKRESYKNMSEGQVIHQYEDYMHMMEELGRDTGDEMIYRPRELKRRHDEAILAIDRQNAALEAEDYQKRFPEAEAVLGTIQESLSYQGEDFEIIVPKRVVDIVVEGRYLHHCAGATDRYFDRIAQRETYIVFLRKRKEPDTPFYTIEVEPGGTIRQHRGMYDEEPEIETVKPFLREWQRVIKRRMSQADRELARVSARKREENIEDLKAKRNTRVLQGLMEDFMEAI